MGQVSVTLNGRTYRLECGEGEEAHLIELAEYLGTHVDVVKRKFGQVGDDRLILMASLHVMDELWELKRQMQEMKRRCRSATRPVGCRRIGEVAGERPRRARQRGRRPAGDAQRAIRRRCAGAAPRREAILSEQQSL